MRGSLLATAALVAALCLTCASSSHAASMTRASVASDGTQGDDESGYAMHTMTMSADGRYVAFASKATNLVPNDTNGTTDVFVHDLQTGLTERVSVASDGTQGDGYSNAPSISADGRYVVFESSSMNLIENPLSDSGIYVRDRVTNQTELVTYGAGFTSISADARYVACDGGGQVHVRDRVAAASQEVSVASDGTPGDGYSQLPSISADGRYVAFQSDASNLVPDKTTGFVDIYVHDCQTGQTERVSVTSDGAEANHSSFNPSISADGRYVVFDSDAHDLAPGGSGYNGRQIFLHDRQTGQTERVSLAPDGAPPDSGVCAYPSISPDGRFVVFSSTAADLVPDDTNGCSDIFVRDRLSGQNRRLSVAEDGTQGDGGSWCPIISATGDRVAFGSEASTLVPGDTNGYSDVFVCLWSSAAFVADVTRGAPPLVVSFTDLSTGSPTSWAWDFGDGGTSADQNPTHTYTAYGSYNVSLTSTGSLGPETETKADYILVVAPAQAAFSASPTAGGSPLEVTFTDESAGTLDSWAWDFGDGGNSHEQDPVHTYTSTGSFDVSLTVANEYGSDTETRADYINVVPAPAADFSATPTAGPIPLVVQFTDQSYQGDPDVWAWDFGDGGTSAEQNPTHTYDAPGHYTVSLEAGNVGGETTRTQTDFILATFTDVPVGHWALDPILACVEAGIVQGYPGGSYHPGEVVNRAQMAVYVARALAHGDAFVPTGPETPHFNDVGTDHWAYDYVEYARFDGIVQGYLDGGYHPDEVVNRGQMAVYIARSVADPLGDPGVPEVPVGTTPAFPDVTADNDWAWCYKYVEYVAGFGIVQGYPNGTYKPEVEVTRDQMAVYVARAFALPM